MKTVTKLLLFITLAAALEWSDAHIFPVVRPTVAGKVLPFPFSIIGHGLNLLKLAIIPAFRSIHEKLYFTGGPKSPFRILRSLILKPLLFLIMLPALGLPLLIFALPLLLILKLLKGILFFPLRLIGKPRSALILKPLFFFSLLVLIMLPALGLPLLFFALPLLLILKLLKGILFFPLKLIGKPHSALILKPLFFFSLLPLLLILKLLKGILFFPLRLIGKPLKAILPLPLGRQRLRILRGFHPFRLLQKLIGLAPVLIPFAIIPLLLAPCLIRLISGGSSFLLNGQAPSNLLPQASVPITHPLFSMGMKIAPQGDKLRPSLYNLGRSVKQMTHFLLMLPLLLLFLPILPIIIPILLFARYLLPRLISLFNRFHIFGRTKAFLLLLMPRLLPALVLKFPSLSGLLPEPMGDGLPGPIQGGVSRSMGGQLLVPEGGPLPVPIKWDSLVQAGGGLQVPFGVASPVPSLPDIPLSKPMISPMPTPMVNPLASPLAGKLTTPGIFPRGLIFGGFGNCLKSLFVNIFDQLGNVRFLRPINNLLSPTSYQSNEPGSVTQGMPFARPFANGFGPVR